MARITCTRATPSSTGHQRLMSLGAMTSLNSDCREVFVAPICLEEMPSASDEIRRIVIGTWPSAMWR